MGAGLQLSTTEQARGATHDRCALLAAQVKAKLKLSGVEDIYLSSVRGRAAGICSSSDSGAVAVVAARGQPEHAQHSFAASSCSSSHWLGCATPAPALLVQNGHKVRSTSELQDIDELCVVEVRRGSWDAAQLVQQQLLQPQRLWSRLSSHSSSSAACSTPLASLPGAQRLPCSARAGPRCGHQQRHRICLCSSLAAQPCRHRRAAGAGGGRAGHIARHAAAGKR